jgi:hypothetical protein
MAAVIEDEAEMDPNIELLQGRADLLAASMADFRAEMRDWRAKQEVDLRDWRARQEQDMRDLRAKQDQDTRELRRELTAGDSRLEAKIDALRDTVSAINVKLENSLRKMTIGWFLSLGAILGVMAKGFHWI